MRKVSGRGWCKKILTHNQSLLSIFLQTLSMRTLFLARAQISTFFAEPSVKKNSRILNVRLKFIRDGWVCAKNYFCHAGCSLKFFIRELRLRYKLFGEHSAFAEDYWAKVHALLSHTAPSYTALYRASLHTCELGCTLVSYAASCELLLSNAALS